MSSRNALRQSGVPDFRRGRASGNTTHGQNGATRELQPMSVVRLSRAIRFLLFGLSTCLLVITTCGCDKMQDAAEQARAAARDALADGEKKADTPAEVAVVSEPTPPPAAPEPIKETPEQIIERFQRIQPREIRDGNLAEVAHLPAGLDLLTDLDLSGARYLTAEGMQHIAQFTHLRNLKLVGLQLPAQAYAPLQVLKELETLDASNSRFDDSAAQFLGGLSSLRVLSLTHTPLSDNGLVALRGLTSLEELYVGATGINGAGFEEMKRSGSLRKLRILHVNQSAFGTAGWKPIQGLATLEELIAGRTGTNSVALLGLRGMVKLRVLGLNENAVADDGVREIAKHKQLEELSLSKNGLVTDLGLSFLKNHKQLKVLHIEGTKATALAVQQLRTKFLPDTEIFSDYIAQ